MKNLAGFLLIVLVACGASTPSKQAADFLNHAASCIDKKRDAILDHLNSSQDALRELSADFFRDKSEQDSMPSEEEIPSLQFEELCDIDLDNLTEEARAIVESKGKQLAAKVMPVIFGAAFSSLSGDAGDANETVLDTVISALRDASEEILEDEKNGN